MQPSLHKEGLCYPQGDDVKVSDIDRLTIVVACLGLLLLDKLSSKLGQPEAAPPAYWTFALFTGVLWQLFSLLGWWPRW